MTPAEKNEYSLRSGENVFFASSEELDAAMMALPYYGDEADA